MLHKFDLFFALPLLHSSWKKAMHSSRLCWLGGANFCPTSEWRGDAFPLSSAGISYSETCSIYLVAVVSIRVAAEICFESAVFDIAYGRRPFV